MPMPTFRAGNDYLVIHSLLALHRIPHLVLLTGELICCLTTEVSGRQTAKLADRPLDRIVRTHSVFVSEFGGYFVASAKPALPEATTETNTNGSVPTFLAPCTWPGMATAISLAWSGRTTPLP